MADIKLDDKETALWKEVGSRGDAFRRAIHDRAADESHATGHVSAILDENRSMVDAVEPKDPESKRPEDALP